VARSALGPRSAARTSLRASREAGKSTIHADSAMLAQVEAEIGARSPKSVKEGFNAFVESGILAHGFLRLRCTECAMRSRSHFSYPPALLRDSCYLLDHGN
jgi:hypothetical protein